MYCHLELYPIELHAVEYYKYRLLVSFLSLFFAPVALFDCVSVSAVVLVVSYLHAMTPFPVVSHGFAIVF